MTRLLRYHVSMRRSIPASAAVIVLAAFAVLSVSGAQAQMNAAQTSSSTAAGVGGHAVVTPHAAVTPLAPNVVAPRTGPVAPPTGVVPFPSIRHHDVHPHHRHQDGVPAVGFYPYAYAVPVPYDSDAAQSDSDADADADPDYQGGPTVFDRRGSGADSYVPPVKDVPTPHAENADADPPAPETPQAPTVLVFKDGQKLEVENYAILGATLFDLTPGHHRRIMLADLDLGVTQKLNEDQGVSFQLPTASQAN